MLQNHLDYLRCLCLRLHLSWRQALKVDLRYFEQRVLMVEQRLMDLDFCLHLCLYLCLCLLLLIIHPIKSNHRSFQCEQFQSAMNNKYLQAEQGKFELCEELNFHLVLQLV